MNDRIGKEFGPSHGGTGMRHPPRVNCPRLEFLSGRYRHGISESFRSLSRRKNNPHLRADQRSSPGKSRPRGAIETHRGPRRDRIRTPKCRMQKSTAPVVRETPETVAPRACRELLSTAYADLRRSGRRFRRCSRAEGSPEFRPLSTRGFFASPGARGPADGATSAAMPWTRAIRRAARPTLRESVTV